MKFYEIFEIYIVNLPEMSNRQNWGVIFRFDKVWLGSLLLRQRVLLRSDSYTTKKLLRNVKCLLSNEINRFLHEV